MFQILTIFNRHRDVYGGGIGPAVAVSRVVILICSCILVGTMTPEIVNPDLSSSSSSTSLWNNHYDPVQLFGLILGALTLVHSLLALVPGTRVSRVHRLFEAGALLVALHLVFLLALRLTKGEMPASYVAPGAKMSRGSRMYSGFFAACIEGVLLLFATAADFLRRKGYQQGGAKDYEGDV